MDVEYTKVAWSDLDRFGYGTSRVYSGPLGCRDVAFVVNRQPPGVSAVYHAHETADETCVLLRGRGEVVVGHHVIAMEEFDAIRVPAGIPHANRNASSSEEAVWMVLGTPVAEYVAEEPHFYGPEAAFPPTRIDEPDPS